jgi:hypothetical protein
MTNTQQQYLQSLSNGITIPFEVIGEDENVWFFKCLGGCGQIKATPKRSGIPQKPLDGDWSKAEIVWQDNPYPDRPLLGARCMDCGPAPIKNAAS